MKRLRPVKTEKPIARGKIIVISIILSIILGGSVFAVAVLLRRNPGYAEAYNDTKEILATEDDLEKGLKFEMTDLTLSDDERATIEKMNNAIDKTDAYLQSLGASGVLRNEEIVDKYNESHEAFEKIRQTKTVSEIVVKLSDDIAANEELSDEDIKMLTETENEYLQNLGKKLQDYKQKVTDFREKYNEIPDDFDEDEMTEEYSAVISAGEKLSEEYAEVEFADIFGESVDELLEFYDRVEELNQILAAKI